MTDTITRIEPLGEPLRGAVRVPGDKSISHRSIIFASMAEGTSKVSGVLDSDDVRSTIGACKALGANIDIHTAADGSLEGTVTGWGAKGPQTPAQPIDCGNSGTTTRLLMGVCAPWDIQVQLFGDSSLSRRPMKRVAGPLSAMGANFEFDEGEHLPVTLKGTTTLKPLTYDSPHASAQVKTAILLAGLNAVGTTTVTEPAPSRNHTEAMLPGFGVSVESAPCFASLTGPQSLTPCDVEVPGDPSSAAFPACAAVICPNSDIAIENICFSETRIGFARVLERMGADISLLHTGACGAEPFGTLIVRHTPKIHGCVVNAEEIAGMVDEIPVLALVAAFAEGETVFHDVSELRVKETDRLAAVLDGLSTLGVNAWADGDDLHIVGGFTPSSDVLQFDSLGDHRLAMTWSLLALCGETPVDIVNFEAVSVSFPTFLDTMKGLIA